MTDDQSRRPDPSRNPDAADEELAADDGTLEPDLEPELEPEPEPEAELEVEPLPEPGPAAAPTPAAAPATGRPRTQKTASAQAVRDVGYRGSLPPRNDHIARPWVITVIAIFVLIFLLAIAGLPSRLLPTATPAPIPSFSLQPVPSSSVAASPQ